MKSLAHQFLDFCRSKPAGEGYDFTDPRGCAWGQFFDQIGMSLSDRRRFEYGSDNVIPGNRRREVEIANAPPGECTFGALATRLEQALNA